MTLLSNEYTFYKFALSFHWNVSKEMSAALKSLAADNSDNKFARFFQTYGTHYIASATYGGKVNLIQNHICSRANIAQSKMLTSVNQNYYSYRTEDEVEAMVGLMYDGFSLGMLCFVE